MPYNRLERRVAALLDSMPGLRGLAKSGYQRFNYLLHGGRRERLRLHPLAVIERVPAVADARADREAQQECFFGYFGVRPWSPDGGRYLFHQWQKGRDSVDICVHDHGGAASQEVAASAAWNFQQGSLAQWLGTGVGGDSIIFNDCVDRQLVCRIVAPDGRERRVPWPIQAIHPGGSKAVSLNYRRLSLVQPEYGYDVDATNFSVNQPLDRDGLWEVDLRAFRTRLVVSLDELSRRLPRPDMQGAAHAVNHVVYSPRGSRIVFMHRWLGSQGLFSRLYCARADGSGLSLLLDHRMISHYAWHDEGTLLVFARTPEDGDRYYLLDVTSGASQVCCAGSLDRYGDGHPSFSPDGDWLVTDSYPDRARMRRLLLCHIPAGKVIEVGAFFSPWGYDGARRCDLHPRWHGNGRELSIDSAHEGVRSTYAIDIGRILAEA